MRAEGSDDTITTPRNSEQGKDLRNALIWSRPRNVGSPCWAPTKTEFVDCERISWRCRGFGLTGGGG